MGLRILVVDDNIDAASTLATLLQMDGHDVSTAFDGNAAMARFASVLPDVAVLDIGMPFMDGLELAAALRALPGGDKLLLIAVSGFGTEEHVEQAKKVGFNAHFTKPVQPQALLQAVAAYAVTLASAKGRSG